MNKAAELIYPENKELRTTNRGKNPLRTLPNKGWKAIKMSTCFIADFKLLADLPDKINEFDKIKTGSNTRLMLFYLL